MARFTLKSTLATLALAGACLAPIAPFNAHAQQADTLVWVVDDVTAQTPCTFGEKARAPYGQWKVVTNDGTPCPAGSLFTFLGHQIPLQQAQSSGKSYLNGSASLAEVDAFAKAVEQRDIAQARAGQIVSPLGCASTYYNDHFSVGLSITPGATVDAFMYYQVNGSCIHIPLSLTDALSRGGPTWEEGDSIVAIGNGGTISANQNGCFALRTTSQGYNLHSFPGNVGFTVPPLPQTAVRYWGPDGGSGSTSHCSTNYGSNFQDVRYGWLH